MSTILIPTDFSDTARNAFVYAVKLFGKDNQYILLNTFEEPHSTGASMISLRDVMEEGSLEGLAEECIHIKNILGEDTPEITSISEYGSSVNSILRVARTKGINLIVMGTTGASGLKEVVMGSVAAGVIQESLVPVLAIPSNYVFRKPKNILLAADLKSNIDAEHLTMLKSIADAANGKITVVTVESDDDDISMDDVEQGYNMHVQLENIEHAFEVVENEDVELALSLFANANGMDMIVTIPRKSNWFQRLLNPSISRKLAQHQQRPVLALTR